MALLNPDQRSRVQHVAVDFLEDPKKVADAMTAASVTADYIFFYSYLQPRPPPGAVSSSGNCFRSTETCLLSLCSDISLQG